MKYLNGVALTGAAVLLAACGGGSDTGGSSTVDNSGANGAPRALARIAAAFCANCRKLWHPNLVHSPHCE